MRGLPSLAAAAAIAVLAAPQARARSYEVRGFDARIEVLPDAKLRVREEITFRFEGSFQGVYRLIPVRYDTRFKPMNLFLRVDSVTDGEGRALRHETSRDGRNLQIKAWVPGAQDAERTVVLSYSVHRALLLDFPDHDELYWNVTGNEWSVPIRSARALVTLPLGVPADGVRAAAFTGPAGSQASEARIERSGGSIEFAASRPFGPGEGLTLVAGWPKGFVRRPPPWRTALWWLSDLAPFFVPPALAFLAAFLYWRRFGRDPRIDRSVMPLYEPPPGLSAAEIGVLTDDRSDMRDITAGILDLAVRGHLRIREEVRKGTFWDDRDYTLERLDSRKGDALSQFDERLLSGLFDGNKTRSLSDLETRFYTHIPRLKELLYDALISKGHYLGSPDGVRRAWRLLGLAVAGAGGAFAWWGLGSIPWTASVAAAGLIVLLFSFIMPAKTQKGAEALWAALGFEEFLSRAEQDRIERRPELFHRYLPHAMALGVTSLWVKAFEGLQVPPPDYYLSPDPFEPASYHRRMSTFDGRLRSTLTSVPRSQGSGYSGGSSAWSGGSGFSGGSSGGGFGGGGGGAF